MRNVCSRVLLKALLFLGLMGPALIANAQIKTEFVQFTNLWRYNAFRTDLGTNWRAFTYAEDGWGTGAGLLGVEDSVPLPYATQHGLAINTTLDIGPTDARTPTVYLRTRFTNSVSGSTRGLALVASNLVDDGCVVFLNGVQAARIRVPTNQIYTTFSPGPAAEGQLDTTNVNPALLRIGENVVAVEVHQTSATSSDLVYGLRLIMFQAQPLTITNQPQSQDVVAGDTVNFTVGVTGGPAFYQWQRNGVNLNVPGATSGSTISGNPTATLSLTNVSAALAGQYRVIITNSLGAGFGGVVTSTVANLTVSQDLLGPKMVSAIIDDADLGNTFPSRSNTIHLRFDESVTNATGIDGVRNINNYRVVPVNNPNARVAIQSIVYNVSLEAILTMVSTDPNWSPTNRYYLVANNVADLRGNRINPYSVIGVSSLATTNLTQMSEPWYYHVNAFFDSDYSPDFLSGAWYRTNYVENSFWAGGVGIFVYDPNGTATVCAGDTFGTQISFQNSPSLFRRTFSLPAGLGRNATLRLRYMVDDGMILYLNGTEVHRFNMPTGNPGEGTRAITTFDGGACTNANIEVTNLLPGTNWLAAAVFQSATPQSDTIFGLEMDVVTLNTAPVPQNPAAPYRPTITRNLRTANQFVLSWPTNNYGFALRYSTNILGSNAASYHNWWTNDDNWIQVKEQSNPYTNSIPPNTGPRRFYQLFRQTRN